MKKLTAILLALMLIIAITPSAFATVYTEKYLHYTIADESITIIGYFGDEETVTVPAMIAGIPVNTIASGAFTDSGIKVLNLPDTITEIENGAIDAGVIINYNSNLPQGGQEQSQPNPPQMIPTQPYYPQPNLPVIVTAPPTTQNDAADDTVPDEVIVSDEEEDITITEEEVEVKIDEPNETVASPQREPQSTKSSQSDDSKPQPQQTNQPEQPAVTTSTESTNSIEEVEVELEKTEEVTTSPADEIPDLTEETEATPAAVPETVEDDTHNPVGVVIAAAIAIAALVLGGIVVWNNKK